MPPIPSPALGALHLAALLYLNPALLGSAFGTALLNGNGELQQLLAFGIGDSSSPESSSKDEV